MFGGPQFGLLGCDSGVDGSFLIFGRGGGSGCRRDCRSGYCRIGGLLLMPSNY